MPKVARDPMVSISFERESIPVDTMRPSKVPDEKWRFVDANGHGHFWDGDKLPTLEWVVTGTEVVGDEYESEEYEVGEYRCRLCAEVVEPKKREEYGPTHIPGLATITVEIDGDRFVLTEEMYAASIERWAEALREIAAKRGP
jgi:hypothetical protein